MIAMSIGAVVGLILTALVLSWGYAKVVKFYYKVLGAL
jgi:hypothetical protein